jgi:hypothetical protein
MSRRPARPSGMPAPISAPLGDQRIALRPLAEAVAEHSFTEFPEISSATATPPALGDPRQLTLPAMGAARCSWSGQPGGAKSMLSAREFPLEHSRNLELAADVVEAQTQRIRCRGACLRAAATRVPRADRPGSAERRVCARSTSPRPPRRWRPGSAEPRCACSGRPDASRARREGVPVVPVRAHRRHRTSSRSPRRQLDAIGDGRSRSLR